MVHSARLLEKLGEPLAAGRTAEIYAWGENQVVKLYHPWVEITDAEKERRHASAAHSLGLPVPAVGDIVRKDGRTGLVLERIEGPSMMDMLEREPERLESFARELAELHISLHQRTPPAELPIQAGLLEERIARSGLLLPADRDATLAALSHMPRGERLCHGDFHPGNIIQTPRRWMIIDWIDATRGRPAADIARTSLLFYGHIATSDVSAETRAAMQLYHDAYLERCLQAGDVDRNEYRRWFPILAAARLNEGIDEQEDWLIQQVRKRLSPDIIEP